MYFSRAFITSCKQQYQLLVASYYPTGAQQYLSASVLSEFLLEFPASGLTLCNFALSIAFFKTWASPESIASCSSLAACAGERVIKLSRHQDTHALHFQILESYAIVIRHFKHEQSFISERLELSHGIYPMTKVFPGASSFEDSLARECKFDGMGFEGPNGLIRFHSALQNFASGIQLKNTAQCRGSHMECDCHKLDAQKWRSCRMCPR